MIIEAIMDIVYGRDHTKMSQRGRQLFNHIIKKYKKEIISKNWHTGSITFTKGSYGVDDAFEIAFKKEMSMACTGNYIQIR